MTELDPKMRVGLRIKELRAELGMSQEAFAYSIEMSRTYFAEVETGKRNVSIENIDRIARGLGVSLKEFFNSDLFVKSDRVQIELERKNRLPTSSNVQRGFNSNQKISKAAGNWLALRQRQPRFSTLSIAGGSHIQPVGCGKS